MAETINAAVGTPPAPNNFQDVETVQMLLNQVPPNQGGPSPQLDVDGMCGPLTIAAIRKFQQFHLGFNDGRVDVNQKTLAKLNEFDNDGVTGNPVKFQEFQPFDGFEAPDPFRNQPPWQMVPLAGSKVVRVINGSAVASVDCRHPNIARALFLGGAVQIFGLTKGDTVLRLKDASNRVLARLDVSVKRKRTVRTAFFFVSDGATPPHATTRTEADVTAAIQGMNDIWIAQANVEFTKLSSQPLNFTQNFGTEVRFTAHLAGVPAAEHEWDTVVARRDRSADFNIFFVNEYEDDTNLATDNADAGTLSSQKSCLCDDSLTGHGLGLVLAHEAGHNMTLDHDTVSLANLMGLAPSDSDRKVTRKQVNQVNP